MKTQLLGYSFLTAINNRTGEEGDGHPLWVSRFIATNKEACILATRDIIRAGGTIVRTATYQSSIDGYMKHMGMSKEEAFNIMVESVDLVKKAIKLEGKQGEVKVAGSVGPYGAYLHNGSEYSGVDYGLTKQELIDWHQPRIEALIKGGVELLALETIPSTLEAYALLELLKLFPDMKAWLSFSIKDNERISSGELFRDAVLKCWEMSSDQLIAVGCNCFHPSLVSPLLTSVRKTHPNIPLIVYPNSGETFDTTSSRWVENSANLNLSDYAQEWFRIGINYLGCCCRTTEKDLKELYRELEKFHLNSSSQ